MKKNDYYVILGIAFILFWAFVIGKAREWLYG